MSAKNVVVVAGVHGVSGRASAIEWSKVPNTVVYGLSRRSGDVPEGVKPVILDLLDPAGTKLALSKIEPVTHVVFGAYIEKATAAEKSSFNTAILANLLDAVDANGSSQLRHVTFYQGGKAYGADLGPFKTPAREDDPRLMPPNFYYDQEDLLRQRQVGRSWSWSALRPEAICGFGLSNPMNLAMSIAIYATISKELGLPLRFPGTEAAYNALYQVTSADILAKATVWAGTTASAENEIFNITNGDYFRWKHLWPRIAKCFDLEVADPIPTPLASYMTDKVPVWERIIEKHGLQPIPYAAVSAWPFADFIFNSGFDNITSTIKARRAGFHECIDSEDMFREFFDELRLNKIIPTLA
ncbi:MAG: SDR family oxidoreductase [Acidobacteriaceae bacterium]|nr:SDR family oxidoreductase [Acidobacteriaceae bacterium]